MTSIAKYICGCTIVIDDDDYAPAVCGEHNMPRAVENIAKETNTGEVCNE